MRERCFELGLGISGTGTGNNFTTADKEARAKDVAWVKQSVELAAKLGARRIDPRQEADQVVGRPLGVETEAEAPMDLKRLMRIVLDSGYRGYLPIASG